MKSWTRIAIVSLGALALASAPFACDKDGDAAKSADKGAGCSHEAKAAAANGKAEGKGCAHADAKAAMANGKAEGKGCAHEGAEAAKVVPANYDDAAGGCMFHSKASDSQRTALEKGARVTLVGTIVCAHCDLNQTKSCKSVFRADNGAIYSIVGNDASEKLSGLTMHGEKKVEVVGTSAKDADEAILLLTSYKLVG